jgi:hypothetical protein
MSIQDYGKVNHKKIKDYINPTTNRVGRESNIFKDKDCLKDQKDCPDIQHKVPNLMKGNPKKQFKKDDVFETGKKELKKSTNKKKEKTPVLKYRNEFHFN